MNFFLSLLILSGGLSAAYSAVHHVPGPSHGRVCICVCRISLKQPFRSRGEGGVSVHTHPIYSHQNASKCSLNAFICSRATLISPYNGPLSEA